MATQVLPFEDVKRFAARLGADINLVQGRSGTLSVKHSRSKKGCRFRSTFKGAWVVFPSQKLTVRYLTSLM